MTRGAVLVSLLAVGFLLSFGLGARGGVLDTTETTATETGTTTEATETTAPTTSTIPETTTEAVTTTTATTTTVRKATTTAPVQVRTQPHTHPALAGPAGVTPAAPVRAEPKRRQPKRHAHRVVRRAKPAVDKRPSAQLISTSPATRSDQQRVLVVAGFGLALLLFGLGALPAEAVRPRTAALLFYERRPLLVLAGAAVFAAAGLAVLLGK